MARTLFLVTRGAGPNWDEARSRPEQDGWVEHGDFMDGLVASGVVLLGGPVSDREAALVMAVASEDAVHAALADDPWTRDRTLVTKSVQRWTVLLDAAANVS